MRLKFKLLTLLHSVALSLISAKALANTSPAYIPEKQLEVATPVRAANEPVLSSLPARLELTDEVLQSLSKNRPLAEELLNRAINQNQHRAVEKLLPIYQGFADADPLLILFAQAQLAKANQNYDQAVAHYQQILAENPQLTPVEIQLASSLFSDYQDKAARQHFQQALSQPIPQDIQQLVQQYLQALDKRNQWQFDVSVNYLNERNINNTNDTPTIENTAFVKGDSMMPQKAKGFGYFVNLAKDTNLFKGHYLHFRTSAYGKHYWDKHDYDEIIWRTYLGYKHKSAQQTWGILPFYEQQWFGNNRYKQTEGGRLEWQRWLSPRWQLSAAAEYGQNHYRENPNLNGSSKLLSSTLLWQPSATSFYYLGGDLAFERTQAARFGYNLASVRLGWGQVWPKQIHTRFTASYTKRDYRDHHRLGAIHFDQARQDNIRQVGLTLWKQDWQLLGIVPKLNASWKQQRSNFTSLYQYRDRKITLLLEKSF